MVKSRKRSQHKRKRSQHKRSKSQHKRSNTYKRKRKRNQTSKLGGMHKTPRYTPYGKTPCPTIASGKPCIDPARRHEQQYSHPPSCKYDEECRRVNPTHKLEFSHKEPCPFGNRCILTHAEHFERFSHPEIKVVNYTDIDIERLLDDWYAFLTHGHGPPPNNMHLKIPPYIKNIKDTPLYKLLKYIACHNADIIATKGLDFLYLFLHRLNEQAIDITVEVDDTEPELQACLLKLYPPDANGKLYLNGNQIMHAIKPSERD